MKCELCGNKIEELFLGKLDGTIVKKDGKQKGICSECQKKNSMEDIKKRL